MTPDGIREKFDLYRKWFKVLLTKEYIDLPSKYQERFLFLLEKLLDDCRKLYEEGKKIKEKTIKIKVEDVLIPDNKEENFIVYGTAEGFQDRIKISLPSSKKIPSMGSFLVHIVYSADEKIWYSSKNDLITKGE